MAWFGRVGSVVVLVAVWVVAARVGAQPAGGAGKRPNVIFILTDDLGYGDVGVFGQNARKAEGKPAHSTPNLDEMAAEGVRLTHHYCPAPVCAPSRASLLLGVHQGHANVRDNQFDKGLENNHTLATVLKGAGYATAAIGKWGLQGKPNGKPPAWPAHPLNRGFDYYYGYIRHKDGHEHYPKEGWYDGPKEVWDNRTEVSAGLEGCYTTDLFAARAKQWIIDQNRGHADQPFFLYLAFDTPHATVEYPPGAYPAGKGLSGGLKWIGKPGEMINTAKGGKVDGWVHPDYAKTDWPDVYMRYATDVRRIDDAVGDVLQLLKDLRIDDQTLVVFTSDNGPSIESYIDQPYAPTFFGSYGPFDGIKRDCWEGGLRVPTIVRWPGRIGAGRESAVASSFADWMATLAEVAGVAAPARCDGVSLVPALTGRGEQRTPRVYVEYFHNQKTPNFEEFEPGHRGRVRRQMQALVIGDYVGVRYDIKKQSDDFEIYDAVKDPKEANNLAKRPEMAALQREFKETALRVRRPDEGAKRPYDKELVPAVAEAEAGATQPGLLWRGYEGKWAWVPQFEGMVAVRQGVVDGVKVEGSEGGGRLDGLIEVPADGKYTFYLSAQGGAELRVHEATVIDADYGYVSGKEVAGEILLKAGRHPIHLAYARRGGRGGAGVKVEWSGPGVERGEIPGRVFSHSEGQGK